MWNTIDATSAVLWNSQDDILLLCEGTERFTKQNQEHLHELSYLEADSFMFEIFFFFFR